MRLPIDQLKEGMQLTRDVVNLNSTILLVAGTSLTMQHVRVLKMWGIESIHVQGSDGENGDTAEADLKLPPEVMKSAEEYVNRRFRHISPNQAAAAVLRRLALRRTAMRMASQVHPGGGTKHES
jgi:hypothetical protein